MSSPRILFATLVAALLLAPTARAQTFTSGSDESLGPIDVSSGTTIMPLPPDGILHATTVTVAAGGVLEFQRNGRNSPVVILASGDVVIDGTIRLRGQDAASQAPGLGAPGGFDGGGAGNDTFGFLPGSGLGPGGGRGGYGECGGISACRDAGPCAGDGSFGTLGRGDNTFRYNATRTYGSPLLLEIVGGSGGAGTRGSPGGAGGGGGGGLLIASSTRIALAGLLDAQGGLGAGAGGCSGGEGSGGGIRLVAPIVEGTGTIDVRGGAARDTGAGRIRVDARDRRGLAVVARPATTLSTGAFMVVLPPQRARIDLIRVADTDIPAGAQDEVVVNLPAGSSPAQEIMVRLSNFTGVVPIEVVLTPEVGDRIVHPVDVDMDEGPSKDVTIPVTFPTNTSTRVNAWTR